MLIVGPSLFWYVLPKHPHKRICQNQLLTFLDYNQPHMAANGFDGPRVQTTDTPASAYTV